MSSSRQSVSAQLRPADPVIRSMPSCVWILIICPPSRLDKSSCAKHNVACQHSQQTRDVDPMLAHHLRHWPSIKPALVHRPMFAGLRSIASWSGTQQTRYAEPMLGQRRRRWTNIDVCQYCVCWVVLTAGGEYKPTPNQCLLIVGPASLLTSIYSGLVSTSWTTGMMP